MEENEISGWSIRRKRDGYYLFGNEIGQVGGACKTIRDALEQEGDIYGGGNTVKIRTNVRLEELFEILNSNALDLLWHNTGSFQINGAPIDATTLQAAVKWYDQMTE